MQHFNLNCVYVLQSHDDDYNNWQSQQSVDDHFLGELNQGDPSPLDTSNEQQISFSDIYTYPMSMDYYDLNADQRQERSYHLKWLLQLRLDLT